MVVIVMVIVVLVIVGDRDDDIEFENVKTLGPSWFE